MLQKLRSQLMVARSKAAEGHLPFWRQLLEMIYLYMRHQIGPGYYLMARFWRTDVAFREKTEHWNPRRYLNYIHQLNDPVYYKISQHKLVEKSFLSAMGIPTARLLGLYHREFGQDINGRPLCTPRDLAALLSSCSLKGVFFKPAEGDSGRGVFGLKFIDDKECIGLADILTNKEMTVETLVRFIESEQKGYVIEEMIEQHPLLARCNPTSVNTLRVWVLRGMKGIEVQGAFLRVGRAGSLVDNTAAGGLACPVDLNTGKIIQALDLSMNRNEHEFHPDSGARLTGNVIPFWRESKALACNALRILPGANFIGIDLAVTADGPLVVEYNVEPSYQGAAHIDRPHGWIFG